MSQRILPIFSALAVTGTPFTETSPLRETPQWAGLVNVTFEISNVSGAIGITFDLEQVGPGTSVKSILTPASIAAAVVDKFGVGGDIDRAGVYTAASYFSIAPAPRQFKLTVANSGVGTCDVDADAEFV